MVDSDEEEEEEDFEDMPPLEGDGPADRDRDMMEDDAENYDADRRVRFDTETESEKTEDKDNYDKNYDYEEEKALLAAHRAAKLDREFPDEIDTPENARNRFQKFRGLASFRTSPWDVNENLPQEYAKIFKFRRWAHAKIRAKKWCPEPAETVAAGQCVTVVLRLTDEDKEKLKAISDLGKVERKF